MDKQPHWLNKSEMAASLGISVQAFDRWGVKPVARIGREAFFDARSVLDNRIAQAARKHSPAGADGEGIDPLVDEKLKQEKLRLTAELADTQELKNAVMTSSIWRGWIKSSGWRWPVPPAGLSSTPRRWI